MIASAREVCEDTIDNCICHFGTCGSIGRRLDGASVDLAAVKKVRCAPCTALQDCIAEARTTQEILESPLLLHVPLPLDDEAARAKHLSKLKKLWRGREACPYHPTPRAKVLSPAPARLTSREPLAEPLPVSTLEMTSSENNQETSEQPVAPLVTQNEAGEANVTTSDTEVAAQTAAPIDDNDRANDSESEPVSDDMKNTEKSVNTVSTDNNDNAVVTADTDSTSASNASDTSNNDDNDNQVEMPGLETSCWAPGNRPEPVKNIPRRAVPVSTPKSTPKAREAAKQLSSMRGFLTGKN